MGKVIRFPGKRRHERASAGSSAVTTVDFRAASAVMRSAVTPAAPAVGVSRIDCHHSSGMRSRCDHLRTAATPAAISAAIDSGEGQSPMIARNEVGAVMFIESPLGQFVLNCKAKVSRDCGMPLGDNIAMADRISETEEKLAFIRRTRLAREARFPKQNPMLTILDLDQGTYKQYESRTPLPHRFIPKFCAATGVSMEWLLANEGKGPVMAEIPKKLEPRVRRGRKAG